MGKSINYPQQRRKGNFPESATPECIKWLAKRAGENAAFRWKLIADFEKHLLEEANAGRSP